MEMQNVRGASTGANEPVMSITERTVTLLPVMSITVYTLLGDFLPLH